MLLPALSHVLLLLSVALLSVSGFRIAPRDNGGNLQWEDWEALFRPHIDPDQLAETEPVTITLDPASSGLYSLVADPIEGIRTLFGIESTDGSNIKRQSMVTSEVIVFDKLAETDAHRNGFEYDNSKRQLGTFVLVTTKGRLILTASSNFLKNALKTGTKGPRTPEVITGLPGFDFFISYLALDQGRTLEEFPPKKTLIELDGFIKNPPRDRLSTLLGQGGTPLALFTVTNPKIVKENFQAITWKIKQLVGNPGLPTVPIAMTASKGDQRSQTLGVYTARGKFGDEDVQYVAALYGKEGGVATMIPIASIQNQENPECEDLQKEIQLDKKEPTLSQGEWATELASWFDTNLSTQSDSHDQATVNKPTVFLIATNKRYWLLAVPPSYLTEQFVKAKGSKSYHTPYDKKKNLEAFARQYIEDQTNPKSFASFKHSMDAEEKFVMYLTLGIRDRRGKVGEDDVKKQEWRYLDHISALWKMIDTVAQKKKMPGLDEVQFMMAGYQTKLGTTDFRMQFSIGVDADLAVTINYGRENQLRITLAPLGASPRIDRVRFNGEAIPLKRLAERADEVARATLELCELTGIGI